MARRGKSAGLDIVGDVIEGAGSAVGGGLAAAGSAIGGALQGLGSAIGGALQGALTEGDKTIVNMGIAGTAAQQNVVTPKSATPPPAEKSATSPSVDENMPTKRLLVIALKYLSSIDNTLKAQLDLDVQSARNEAAATREQQIESAGLASGSLGKIGDSVGVTKRESGQSIMASGLAKKFAGLAAGAGFFAIMGMDQSQFAKLEENIAAFKDKYAWLVEIAAAGGLLGFMAKKRLGILGILGLDMVIDYLSDGQKVDENGNPVRPGTFQTALGLGLAGYVGYDAYKRIRSTGADVRRRGGRMTAIRNAPRAAPSLRGSGFRDPRTGRAVSREAAAAGGGWLAGPKGQRFVAFLSRRFGSSYVAKKIMPLLARVFAGVAITATGVGAIPGILWTLLNIGLGIYTVYELLDAWWDFQDEEAELDARTVTEDSATPRTPDANREAGTGVTPTSNREYVKYQTSGDFKKDSVVVGVIDAGPGWTTVKYEDGSTERRGGTRASRNNNPGNISYGEFAISQGAVGSDGRFAVFPTPRDGFQAMKALLQTGNYANLTVAQAITRWAPPSENDTQGYINSISSLGIDVNKRYSDLSDYERDQLVTGMAKKEGYFAEGSGPQMDSGGGSGVMDTIAGFTKESLATVMTGIKKFIKTDTVFDAVPGMEHNTPPPLELPTASLTRTESDRVATLAREQIQMEANEIAGMKENADLAQGQSATSASAGSTIQSAIRNANGGSLDVMNPNYKVEASSILNNYLMFFGLGSQARAAVV